MQVFGDAHHVAPTTRRAQDLLLRVGRAEALGAAAQRDAWRTLLVLAGQLEQGLADRPGVTQEIIAAAMQATDLLAAQLVEPHPVRHARALRAALERVAGDREVVDIKVPEGLAFYGLSLEAYAAAARDWSRASRGDPQRALVIGLRSVGTTLSAVVAAALRAQGRPAQRMTVRPAGHPFSRRVELRGEDLAGGVLALVVDEGPGLSGSSLAAVARALISHGLSPRQIAFITGHGGGPGREASDEIREIWGAVRVHPAEVHGVGPDPAEIVESLLGTRSPLSVASLAGGLWRDAVYAPGRARPPAMPLFERPKYGVTIGGQRRFLLEFHGSTWMRGDERTGAEYALDALAARARRGFARPPIGARFGFVLRPWIDGAPVRRADRGSLDGLSRYLAEVPDALSEAERREARERLTSMTEENIAELMPRLCRARAVAALGRFPLSGAAPCAQDHRVAPEHFLLGRSIYKVGGVGRDVDHTLVGRQPLAWDIAGAMVEWRLAGPRAYELLARLDDSGTHVPSAEELRFHRLAYAAFRLGLCAFVRSGCSEAREARRLDRALGRYRREIVSALNLPADHTARGKNETS